MIRENCSLIGTITKPHGIGGQLILRLNSDFADDIEPGEPLFVKVDETLVPFFIEEAEVYPDRAILKLEFITNPQEAQKFAGMNVYLENRLISEKSELTEANAEIFTGYLFYDKASGMEGIIKEYIDNPLNPLFLVSGESTEFLIPVHPDFIVNVDHRKKMVVFDLPDGLMGL
jgi:16S rRNA processing protein RimM